MFIVGEAVIDDDVARAPFCCDLAVCKGACCSLAGGRGAPLEDAEVIEIERAYPLVKRYLPEHHIHTIETEGLVEGRPGDFATVCISERECVFAYFEEDVAQCGFEKAFLDGHTGWRKPLSCHLFPIRVRKFGREFIRYEQIEECRAGRARGEKERIQLYDFLRTSLVRNYGESWYESFRALCKTQTVNRASSC
jgi:hypothetical protein